jgi:hypothetical protein
MIARLCFTLDVIISVSIRFVRTIVRIFVYTWMILKSSFSVTDIWCWFCGLNTHFEISKCDLFIFRQYLPFYLHYTTSYSVWEIIITVLLHDLPCFTHGDISKFYFKYNPWEIYSSSLFKSKLQFFWSD